MAKNPTASLRQVALAMREAGVAHTWRDEQLAVTDSDGRMLGVVERAVVRPLGITTFAVHLTGVLARWPALGAAAFADQAE